MERNRVKGACISWLAFLFLSFSQVPAQDHPALRLTLSPYLQDGVQSIHFSDLDFLEQGIANYIFDLYVLHVLQEWEGVELMIELNQEEENIVRFESSPFTLVVPPSGGSEYHATNMDLTTSGTFPGSGIHIHWTGKHLSMPDMDFQTYLIKSGRLERGRYILKATMRHALWESTSEVKIIITNPSLIRLLSPFDSETVHTEFPLFQYESDASEFLVSLYRKDNEKEDVESVLSGHPIMEYTTSEKQFTYDQSGGEPLQSGQTYYWVVTASVTTTHGNEEYKSEVWEFTVNTESAPGEWLDLTSLLEPLLGDQAESIAKALSGYHLKTIHVNGEEITLQKLYEIIDAYRNKVFDVQDVTIQ